MSLNNERRKACYHGDGYKIPQISTMCHTPKWYLVFHANIQVLIILEPKDKDKGWLT